MSRSSTQIVAARTPQAEAKTNRTNNDFNFENFIPVSGSLFLFGLTDSHPQQGLSYRDIAPYFIVFRIGWKLFPEVQIFFVTKREAGEKQTWLSRRPAFPRLRSEEHTSELQSS